MDSNKWRTRMIENAMRQDRMADKALENSSKPLLLSSDLVQTTDCESSKS